MTSRAGWPPKLVGMDVRGRLALALRDRVAGENAEERARSIWLAPGPRRFAPGDPICRVHGHAAMYAGGIRALLLQMLHPLAMAGVGHHSGYKGDPWGRLQRTSEYIAMTTFGPDESADKVIARIRKIHDRVIGHAPDGREYRASDPHLLRWVHVAEIDSFLTSYQWHAAEPLTPDEADRYVDQAAWAAAQLGVVDPPWTVAGLQSDLASFRPELALTESAKEAADFLLREPPLPWAARPGYWMLAAGAVAMLPEHARQLLGLHVPGVRGRVLDAAVRRPLGRAGTAAVHWELTDPRDLRHAPGSSVVTAHAH